MNLIEILNKFDQAPDNISAEELLQLINWANTTIADLTMALEDGRPISTEGKHLLNEAKDYYRRAHHENRTRLQIAD